MLLLFWLSSLSPSQFWTLTTTAALHSHRALSVSIHLPSGPSGPAQSRRGACARDGGDVPSNVAVAQEYRCHGQCLGESGRELGAVAFGQRLLVGDHCDRRCQSLVAKGAVARTDVLTQVRPALVLLRRHIKLLSPAKVVGCSIGRLS